MCKELKEKQQLTHQIEDISRETDIVCVRVCVCVYVCVCMKANGNSGIEK